MENEILYYIQLVLESPPPSALAGVGLIILFFGLRVSSVLVVLNGIYVGALPGALMLLIKRGMSDPRGVELFVGPASPLSLDSFVSAPILIMIIGGFSGGYLALTSRKAIKFIFVGLTWLLLQYTVWPEGYGIATGKILALTGFFVAGYMHEHLLIIATSALGASIIALSMLKVLKLNYPSAHRFMSDAPLLAFLALAVMAFAGSVYQVRTACRKKDDSEPVEEDPEPLPEVYEVT